MVCSRGYHSNGADNQELVQEPKQSSTSLHSVIGRTDVDGRQIPDDNSILFVPSAGVTTHESTTRSTPARADTGKHFRVNGRATQVHNRGMQTAEAQGVQHVRIKLKHQHACSMGHMLAAKVHQAEASDADSTMLRTYAYQHDHQGRLTLVSGSVTIWHDLGTMQSFGVAHWLITASVDRMPRRAASRSQRNLGSCLPYSFRLGQDHQQHGKECWGLMATMCTQG